MNGGGAQINFLTLRCATCAKRERGSLGSSFSVNISRQR